MNAALLSLALVLLAFQCQIAETGWLPVSILCLINHGIPNSSSDQPFTTDTVPNGCKGWGQPEPHPAVVSQDPEVPQPQITPYSTPPPLTPTPMPVKPIPASSPIPVTSIPTPPYHKITVTPELNDQSVQNSQTTPSPFLPAMSNQESTAPAPSSSEPSAPPTEDHLGQGGPSALTTPPPPYHSRQISAPSPSFPTPEPERPPLPEKEPLPTLTPVASDSEGSQNPATPSPPEAANASKTPAYSPTKVAPDPFGPWNPSGYTGRRDFNGSYRDPLNNAWMAQPPPSIPSPPPPTPAPLLEPWRFGSCPLVILDYQFKGNDVWTGEMANVSGCCEYCLEMLKDWQETTAKWRGEWTPSVTDRTCIAYTYSLNSKTCYIKNSIRTDNFLTIEVHPGHLSGFMSAIFEQMAPAYDTVIEKYFDEIPTDNTWHETLPKPDCPEKRVDCNLPHCRQIYARLNETKLGVPYMEKWEAERFGADD